MRKLLLKTVGIVIILLLISCKTYTIVPESFKKQMIKATSENMTEVEISNPLNYNRTIKYSTNDIDKIIVMDKNGNPLYLDNSASIEMRITVKNGKKYHMYFDTVLLENDTLKGGRSRFIQGAKREIPMDSIVTIEIQDGGKKFNYQN